MASPIDPQASAIEMLGALDSGDLSAIDLLAALAPAMERTATLGGTLGDAIDASPAARASDARRAAGHAGRLEGLPISVKGNIGLDGIPTSGATPLLADHSLAEGGAIARLRAAGTVIALRTNLHELAFGITGANAHSGDGRNPFDPDFLAGGSSCGAAISVATGAVPIALGTDTGGSCRVPAAHCGVVGFRPTTGRYPCDEMIDLSPSRDTLGLFARTVADIALADGVIAADTKPLSPPEPRTLRLGCVRFAPIDPQVAATFDAALAALAAAGVTIEDRDLSAAIAADDACGFPIAVYEAARSLERIAADALGIDLATFAAGIASADVRALVTGQTGPDAIPEAVYRAAIEEHLPQLRAAFDTALADIDALIYPTSVAPPPPVGCGETIDVDGVTLPTFVAFTLTTRPDSMAGQPTIALPMGTTTQGLPLGLQLCGGRGEDRGLLSLAAAIAPLLPPRPIPR